MGIMHNRHTHSSQSEDAEQSWVPPVYETRRAPLVLALREVTHCFEQLPQMERLLKRALDTEGLSNAKKIPWAGMPVPGDGDDRYRRVHLPQFLDDFQPALRGQQHVQDNHVHGRCLGALHSLVAIAGLDSLVALAVEQLTEHVACRGIIINNQNTYHDSSLLHCTLHHPLPNHQP